LSYTIIDCEQRSDAWYAARAGRLTGSVACDAMKTIKSGAFSAARKHLRMCLALERITGRPQESGFISKAMQNGIDKEPMALARYEAESGEILERPGFLRHTELLAGCSLDAAIISGGRIVGIVEGKAPESATHFEYLRTRAIPEEYQWQCIHGLWISGADWCDFCSFDDRFPEDLQYLCVRIERDEKAIRAYEIAALRFLAEVAEEVEAINKLRAVA
jgi:YqaJ-like viral recombinase domain